MKTYLINNRYKLFVGFLAVILAAFGVFDAAAATGFVMIGDVELKMKELEKSVKDAFETLQSKIKANQDAIQTALDQLKRGDEIHAKTADELKANGEAAQKAQKELFDKFNTLADRIRDVEQKADKRAGAAEDEQKSAGQIFVESEEYKALMEKTGNGQSNHGWDSKIVKFDRKAAIMNEVTLTNDQPLVPAQRLPGIIMPGLRRLTIRDLLPNLRTSSNLVEFASELLFTSGAGPQYDASSPSAGRDGAPKGESSLTFQLANAPVITIAHFIPASRQILRDAPALRGYIDARLTYGLKLEEEDELLNGTGASGKLDGLRNNATQFTGGATNQSEIDTLLKALTQVSLSYYEPSGIILHPIDWQTILLKKDSQGRYLFGNPHGVTAPSIWGKPVVATQAMAQGNFLTGAFDLCAAIFDAEDMSIRVAEQHSDWFTRNLVALLCEERLALAIFRSAAMVKGSLSYAG